MLACAYAESGEVDAARRELEVARRDDYAALRQNPLNGPETYALFSDACVAAEHGEAAAELYEILLPLAGELILKDGVWHPFDFANPCPDSQVTSLHVHFPWIVLSKIRWALFCAATKRPMRQNLDWAPYYEIAARDIPYREKLSGYADIARDRMDADAFEEFCATHLSNLDEVAREFFGSDRAKDAVRMKVQALFPEHEWDEFTERFWGHIQDWRGVPA